jgi:hypothetical protein
LPLFVAQRGVALLSLFRREKSVLGSDTPDGKLLVAVKHGKVLTSYIYKKNRKIRCRLCRPGRGEIRGNFWESGKALHKGGQGRELSQAAGEE